MQKGADLRRRLAEVTMSDVRAVSVQQMDTLQRFETNEQVVGFAATFLIVCEELGVEPRDALQVAANVLSWARKTDGKDADHFEAVRLYVRNEL